MTLSCQAQRLKKVEERMCGVKCLPSVLFHNSKFLMRSWFCMKKKKKSGNHFHILDLDKMSAPCKSFKSHWLTLTYVFVLSSSHLLTRLKCSALWLVFWLSELKVSSAADPTSMLTRSSPVPIGIIVKLYIMSTKYLTSKKKQKRLPWLKSSVN